MPRPPILSCIRTAGTPRGHQASLQPHQSLSSTAACHSHLNPGPRTAGKEAPQAPEAGGGNSGGLGTQSEVKDGGAPGLGLVRPLGSGQSPGGSRAGRVVSEGGE